MALQKGHVGKVRIVRWVTHETARKTAKYDRPGVLEQIRMMYPTNPVPNKQLKEGDEDIENNRR